MRRMADCELRGRVVLLREDLNVPMDGGRITNTRRIEAALSTIREALGAGARLRLLSHLGRPQAGQSDPALSLAPVAAYLSQALDRPVPLLPWTEAVWREPPPEAGELVLHENIRFLPGEREDDPELATRLAGLCELFVMDAFATAHRAEASTHGVILKAPEACAGPLLIREVEALTRIIEAPERPLVAIIGGAKISTKIDLLNALLDRVDGLILGGGILNTLLYAQGFPVGQSLCEHDAADQARNFLAVAQARGKEIPMPVDVVVGHLPMPTSEADVRPIDKVASDEWIFDIGPRTIARYRALLSQAKTLLWNGPVGVFEYDQFAQGTEAIARAMVQSGAYTVVGGGDSLAALDRWGLADRVSYCSTAGGAFIEFVEGRPLPALEALRERGGGP
jgi:phosphoglycerate kinase